MTDDEEERKAPMQPNDAIIFLLTLAVSAAAVVGLALLIAGLVW